MERFLDRPFVLPAIVLGLGFVLSAIIGAYTFYAVKSLDNTVTVTGSATQEVKADRAKWTIAVSRTVTQDGIPSAYAAIGRDEATAKEFLTSQGIPADAITMMPITSNQNYSSDSNAPVTYNVQGTMTVQSDDVNKIQTLSQSIGSLVTRGILLTAYQPEYYVTNLAELRIQLLGKAITDAKARAEQLVKNSGSSVGKLKSAGSGVVQVLAPNSTSVEDYGAYDTSTIDKQIMVTARATFLVK